MCWFLNSVKKYQIYWYAALCWTFLCLAIVYSSAACLGALIVTVLLFTFYILF